MTEREREKEREKALSPFRQWGRFVKRTHFKENDYHQWCIFQGPVQDFKWHALFE